MSLFGWEATIEGSLGELLSFVSPIIRSSGALPVGLLK